MHTLRDAFGYTNVLKDLTNVWGTNTGCRDEHGREPVSCNRLGTV